MFYCVWHCFDIANNKDVSHHRWRVSIFSWQIHECAERLWDADDSGMQGRLVTTELVKIDYVSLIDYIHYLSKISQVIAVNNMVIEWCMCQIGLAVGFHVHNLEKTSLQQQCVVLYSIVGRPLVVGRSAVVIQFKLITF